jgi:hypothetical protein
MTRLTSQHTFVKFVIGYTALGFFALEIACLSFCRPFSQYWAFPVKNVQCMTYWNYCIVQTVFNISSDAIMLAIPIPFIIKANLPPLKKILLFAIFSLGIFVITAAILHKVYNFTMPETTIYMIWNIRETSTSIYVANIMCWWPLLRKLFGFGRFVLSSKSRSQISRDPITAPAHSRSRSFGMNMLKKDGTEIGYEDLDDRDLEHGRPSSQVTINKPQTAVTVSRKNSEFTEAEEDSIGTVEHKKGGLAF